MKLLSTAIAVISIAAWILPAQNSGDGLQRGFLDPPNSARPRVWWHWMNGNITQEGIKADLEWMKRTGIGGFQNFDAALELGFASAIRREWAWRAKNGESLANLQAFARFADPEHNSAH